MCRSHVTPRGSRPSQAHAVRKPCQAISVLLLSEPQDPATLKLPQPIANDLVSRTGRRTAFTMDRRYVRAARLLRAKRTSDLV